MKIKKYKQINTKDHGHQLVMAEQIWKMRDDIIGKTGVDENRVYALFENRYEQTEMLKYTVNRAIYEES